MDDYTKGFWMDRVSELVKKVEELELRVVELEARMGWLEEDGDAAVERVERFLRGWGKPDYTKTNGGGGNSCVKVWP